MVHLFILCSSKISVGTKFQISSDFISLHSTLFDSFFLLQNSFYLLIFISTAIRTVGCFCCSAHSTIVSFCRNTQFTIVFVAALTVRLFLPVATLNLRLCFSVAALTVRLFLSVATLNLRLCFSVAALTLRTIVSIFSSTRCTFVFIWLQHSLNDCFCCSTH